MASGVFGVSGGTAAAVVLAAVVVLVLAYAGFQYVSSAIRGYMQERLGDYYEYAAMLYWPAVSLVALFALLLFLIPFWAWLLLVLGVLIVGAVIVELAC